ncbi:MAG: SRPBCC family protein [Candidatus Dormibacteria bacterium]
MHVETSFEIGRPPEKVFDFLADATNEAKWNPWTRWVKQVSTGPIGKGSIFRGSYKGFGELDQDLSVFDRPHTVVYHSTPKGMHQATMAFHVEPTGLGTCVRIIGDAAPKGVMKLMEPMMGLRMRPHLRDVSHRISEELGAD